VELTESLVALHERLRGDGVSIEESAKLAGHGVGTWYKWKKLGEEGEDPLAVQFFQRVVLGERKRETVAEGDWRDIGYFESWVAGDTPDGRPLVLDSGEPFEPESWQLDAVADLLSGQFKAVVLVVPEANGKTTLLAAVALYLLEHQISAEIPIGSASVEQATTLFRQIEGFVTRSGKLRQFKLASGLRRIDARRTGGHVRVYPHNERSGDGVIPSTAILDELHLHPSLRLYRTWKGKGRKRNGPLIAISTAGEVGSEFEAFRDKLLREGELTRTSGSRGQYRRMVLGDTVLHDFAVRDPGEATDFAVVAGANPLAAITAAELAGKYAEPEMTDSHWRRRTCNIATRYEGREGITSQDWDALRELDLVPDRTAWAIGCLDLGWKIDCAAMTVIVWESHGRRVITGTKVFEPPVSERDVVEALVALQREFEPIGWVYDPNAGGQQMAQLLETGEHPHQDKVEVSFIEHSQANKPMEVAAARLDESIRNGWLVHNGDEVLRAHVLNAVRRNTYHEKYRYDRPDDAKGELRGKYPIDALTALLMGHSVAVAEHEDEKPKEPLFAFVGR
jgi:phage terminase large subunit-like protein